MGIAIADSGQRVFALYGDSAPESSKVRVQAVFEGREPLKAAENTAALRPLTGENRKILDVAKNLEQISLSFNRRLQFVVDHKSNEISVKVIDKATDKVIKVLPPEELQRLHSRIEETIGFLFDETV
ncbi:MAG: flagellar protein FlaG [Treponema sp.]|nr:flagellar protein FlaG [Treponema sp.]